jgi:hypothetical protein
MPMADTFGEATSTMAYSINSLIDDILSESEEDHVSLKRIIESVRRCLGDQNNKAIVLILLRLLLEAETVKIGGHAANGRDFVEWQLCPALAIERIDHEWELLTGDSPLSEVVFITASPCHSHLVLG